MNLEISVTLWIFGFLYSIFSKMAYQKIQWTSNSTSSHCTLVLLQHCKKYWAMNISDLTKMCAISYTFCIDLNCEVLYLSSWLQVWMPTKKVINLYFLNQLYSSGRTFVKTLVMSKYILKSNMSNSCPVYKSKITNFDKLCYSSCLSNQNLYNLSLIWTYLKSSSIFLIKESL